MNKQACLQKLIEEKGEDWVKRHTALLDAEWEYIETLGDPDAIDDENSDDDFIISTPLTVPPVSG